MSSERLSCRWRVGAALHGSVFGSYARDEADEYSDIDLLVDRGGGRPLRVLGLGTEVEEATRKSVDIYDVSELLPDKFKDIVLAEAMAL